jgi:glycosyltransferase involved in cell wall biosynthesis
VIHPGSADTANEEKLAREGIKKLYRRPSAVLFNWLQSRNWNSLRKLISRIESHTGILAARDRRHLHRLIRSKGIDLVNSHMYLADSYCCQMLNTLPVPIVTTLHGCYNLITEEIAQGKYDAAYIAEYAADTERVTRRLNGIIYLTDRQLSAVPVLLDAPIPKKKIYNGFRQARENHHPATTGDKPDWHFGMVARGIASKGWEELILAYNQVKANNPSKKMRLSLAGDSDFLKDLQKKYSDPDIIFHGRVADPLLLMQHWDVGVLPTYFDAESLPNSVIEYLYAGLPVIATEIAEIPNMIDSAGSHPAGFLIPLKGPGGKPDPNTIANAMQRYVDDKALWEEHCRNATGAYKKFDIDVCIDSYRDFFGQVKPPTPL